jgi:hypothetical protein
MKDFHFSKIYFNKLIFDDPNTKIRIVVDETPSLDINQEEYSLRVTTRHEEDRMIHRDYAIEHALSPSKHAFPHIQFKFHTEEVGQFRVRVDFENQEEYKKGVLGFIYKIKDILTYLEKFRKGITNEILVIELVNNLDKEAEFLTNKINEGIKKYSIIFDGEEKIRDKLKRLEQNQLLLEFMGLDNIKLIEDSYKSIKK